MYSKFDIQPKDFSYRLFLDDYITKSKQKHKVYEDFGSKDLYKTTSRQHSNSLKLEFGDLDEMNTFCCIEEDFSSDILKTKSKEGFSLQNCFPKKENFHNNDIFSIVSMRSSFRKIKFDEIEKSIKNIHFEKIHQYLLNTFDKIHGNKERFKQN